MSFRMHVKQQPTLFIGHGILIYWQVFKCPSKSFIFPFQSHAESDSDSSCSCSCFIVVVLALLTLLSSSLQHVERHLTSKSSNIFRAIRAGVNKASVSSSRSTGQLFFPALINQLWMHEEQNKCSEGHFMAFLTILRQMQHLKSPGTEDTNMLTGYPISSSIFTLHTSLFTLHVFVLKNKLSVYVLCGVTIVYLFNLKTMMLRTGQSNSTTFLDSGYEFEKWARRQESSS